MRALGLGAMTPLFKAMSSQKKMRGYSTDSLYDSMPLSWV